VCATFFSLLGKASVSNAISISLRRPADVVSAHKKRGKGQGGTFVSASGVPFTAYAAGMGVDEKSINSAIKKVCATHCTRDKPEKRP
jgi:hypothetical protein